jgi:hypothetical protein
MMRRNTCVLLGGDLGYLNVIANDRQPRMMYSTSKEAIKRALNGLAADIQANDADDIEWDNIKSRVSKGR